MKALIQQLPVHLQDRARLLRDKSETPSSEFVLYWMRTAVRVDENPALDAAIEFANQLELPVLVYHALSERYPYANDRHHTFILEGARDVRKHFAERFDDRVAYAFHLERPAHRGPHLKTLADRAAVVVTEDMPVEPLRSWTVQLSRSTKTPVVAVDTACVVPMQVVGKAYERAFAFRDATKRHYAQRLTAAPYCATPNNACGNIELPFEPVELHNADIPQLVADCEIDHSIGPVVDTAGGSVAGYARWEAFKEKGLLGYAKKRNDALTDGVSRMSAYFHYGMVSPQRIARECADLDHAGSEKYLDELLIWRELAYAFCFYRPDHGRLSAIPKWAIETLAEHESDSRPALHSWETLARAETDDELWNAAQRSLLIHGELHNNVRMTWGKAILSWTSDAKSALATMIDLNHRYALDGRDPASYGGLLWCLGQFDRPFKPANSILGTVRGRPTALHAERLDVSAYAGKTSRPLSGKMPAVAIVGAGMSGLACARTLVDHGYEVTVFEKSRGFGGRMATRRVEHPADEHGQLQFDHGAQYFTARDKRFRRYVDSWLQDGLLQRWNGRIAVIDCSADKPPTISTKTGTDRYVATPAMNSLAKHLAADVTVKRETLVAPLKRENEQWRIHSDDGMDLGAFDVAIVSAPAYQTARLLQTVPELAAKATATKMNGCWALMLAFEEPLNLDFDAAFVNGSPISWVAKNSSKPARHETLETWVVHASAEWSEAHMEESFEDMEDKLLTEFFKAVSVEAKSEPCYQKAHRWRYAIPPDPLPDACLFDAALQVGACGDWCAGPRVEGAFLSGMAMAGRVMGMLKQTPQELSACR